MAAREAAIQEPMQRLAALALDGRVEPGHDVEGGWAACPPSWQSDQPSQPFTRGRGERVAAPHAGSAAVKARARQGFRAFPGSEHWARPERSFAGWDAGLAIHSSLKRWALTWIRMPLRVAPLCLPTQSHQIIKDAIRLPRSLSTGLPKHTAACFSRPKPPPSGTHADQPLSAATRNLCFRFQIFRSAASGSMT